MNEASFIEINPTTVNELLGPPRFMRDDKMLESQIGIVQGLAWTQAGGEVLLIEALKMKGKGGLMLTGQLGDVMKESAHAAMSYAKAHMDELNISADFFEKNGVQMQTHTIDATAGGTFTSPQGTVVTIPANAFVTGGGAPITGNVNIEFKDIYKKSDMLLSNMSTQTATGPLKSAGEFFIKEINDFQLI